MQRISVKRSNCVFRWIEIYPVDGIICHLNNWGHNYNKILLSDRLYMNSPDFSINRAVRIMPKYLNGTRHRVRN